jgi:hypothetical protein
MDGIESLSGIATFVAVARAASFTGAGDVLGISKSAVGKAVARLEERLGVKLFHRTTRRLALPPTERPISLYAHVLWKALPRPRAASGASSWCRRAGCGSTCRRRSGAR